MDAYSLPWPSPELGSGHLLSASCSTPDSFLTQRLPAFAAPPSENALLSDSPVTTSVQPILRVSGDDDLFPKACLVTTQAKETAPTPVILSHNSTASFSWDF